MRSLRDLCYDISEYGWGPKSEVLPGRIASAARALHSVMWWCFVWPWEWAARDFQRWARWLRESVLDRMAALLRILP